MSAPATEAAQPTLVADATPAEATQEQVKQEETKQEDVTADAQLKQEESASKTEETAADATGDVKMEVDAVKTETNGEEVKKEESDTKSAPSTSETPAKGQSGKKFDPTVLPDSDDPDLIRGQFEFYFSNSNLPCDKHMWTITGGTENKPVKVTHILGFGRCKRFKNRAAVIAALKDSPELEVSGPEGDEVVKRKEAYVSLNESPEERVARSVYVKGFGDETPTTQIEIEQFFRPYGPVRAIRLRRTDKEQYFKGSVFVEFGSQDAAKAFLAVDPAPTYQGRELKIMSKKAYMEEKNQLIKEGKVKPQTQQRAKFWEGREIGGDKKGRGGGRGGGNRGGDKDNWKERRENDQRNGHRGGRGGRGRGGGRGGRGRGGRDDRNGRDRRQDAPSQVNTNNVQRPRINTTEASANDVKKDNGKRAREDDAGAAAAEPPAKKVDTKTDAAPA